MPPGSMLRRVEQGPGGTDAGGSSSTSSATSAAPLLGLRTAVWNARDRWDLKRDPTYRRLAQFYRFPDGIRRVYCHHIRKTAGTSLYLTFLGLGGEDPMDVWRRIAAARLHRTVSGGLAFAANHREVLAEGAYYFGRSHRPATAQPLPADTFTITVLRDPVARVHSYFDYLVAGDDPSMPGRVGDEERSIALDGFDRFLERVPNHDLLNQLAMFSGTLDVAEAADRIAACSAALTTEEFADGLATVGRRLDLTLEMKRSRVTGNRSVLTDRQRERLAHRLEPEYELLRRLGEQGTIPTRRSDIG